MPETTLLTVGPGVIDLAQTTVDVAVERLKSKVVELVGGLVPAESMDEMEVLFGQHGETLVTMTQDQAADTVRGLLNRPPTTQAYLANLQQLSPTQVADLEIARWAHAVEIQAQGIGRRAEAARALAALRDNTLRLGIAVGLAVLTGGASSGAAGLLQAALSLAATE